MIVTPTPTPSMLTVGDTAPDFSLRQNFQVSWSLDDLIADGPAVLAFYPFDFGQF
ncbi:MAG: peroxiredoxin [Verrucomicrobiales bacterium]|jgi:peroxiredoxin